MRFYLGVHHPHWLSRTTAPLFVSARRLRGRRTFPRASCSWALDSGGFTELSLFGEYVTPATQYASEARHWQDRIGGMAWAAVQDWMCEPHVLARTGFAVGEHQRRTVHSYRLLRQLAPDLPWLPVLQGWTREDYLDHLRQYRAAGFDLAREPLVGLGSVCRRQDTGMAESLVRELHGRGLRLHLFGFKLGGLRRVGDLAASADSMAWSFAARRRPPLTGCTHRNCANCLAFALRWRERVLDAIGAPKQLTLF